MESVSANRQAGSIFIRGTFFCDEAVRFSSQVLPCPCRADQVDEDDGPVIREQFVLPTAPRAARGSGIDESRIPRGPPYTAFIANLSFETNVDEITRFFGKLNVKSVRLVREGNSETGRLKGIGYVDFEDRQSLVEAIGMDGLVLQVIEGESAELRNCKKQSEISSRPRICKLF